jgi:hypothetical protein
MFGPIDLYYIKGKVQGKTTIKRMEAEKIVDWPQKASTQKQIKDQFNVEPLKPFKCK